MTTDDYYKCLNWLWGGVPLPAGGYAPSESLAAAEARTSRSLAGA